jgi:glyoxylase-like metal-dependent hydrolase (beta-lactamase superfamily II)
MPATTVIALPVAGKRSINAYLVLGRRPILVDAGTPDSAEKICGAIVRHGVDPTDVALIVLTHGHIDHFGSAAELGRLTRAPIAGHAADLGPYKTGRSRQPYQPTGPMGYLFSKSKLPHAQVEAVEPDVVLHGPMSLYDYGVDARVVPTPGHTAGSISVLTDTGDLVAGDMVASSFMGFVAGRPANPPFHDDPVRNLASLREMLALKPTALYVGHGGRLDPHRVARWAAKQQRRLDNRTNRSGLPLPHRD